MRWAVLPKAKWVDPPAAKWAAWAAWVALAARWVAHPVGKWAAWAALSVGWVALLPVDKRVAWVPLVQVWAAQAWRWVDLSVLLQLAWAPLAG